MTQELREKSIQQELLRLNERVALLMTEVPHNYVLLEEIVYEVDQMIIEALQFVEALSDSQHTRLQELANKITDILTGGQSHLERHTYLTFAGLPELFTVYLAIRDVLLEEPEPLAGEEESERILPDAL